GPGSLLGRTGRLPVPALPGPRKARLPVAAPRRRRSAGRRGRRLGTWLARSKTEERPEPGRRPSRLDGLDRRRRLGLGGSPSLLADFPAHRAARGGARITAQRQGSGRCLGSGRQAQVAAQLPAVALGTLGLVSVEEQRLELVGTGLADIFIQRHEWLLLV